MHQPPAPKSKRPPQWSESPLRWAIWYLQNNGHVYTAYRVLINDARQANPDIRISSDQVLHVLRWSSKIRAKGDVFEINDHCSALFSRLYVEEYPAAEKNFGSRRSIWDSLTAQEHHQLMMAFEPLRLRSRS